MRKEYLYTKSQEAKEREKQDRRVKVRNAIDNDKAIYRLTWMMNTRRPSIEIQSF